ncbi:HAD family hydrolase [Paenibacillus radicis (ex Xue et al. 2023)]|uniref:HAD family phosphatase n=1 Tax=Paenibacillus radicis (ex Xue et al. 2023) TaxID=2972489 RepID=A0ABT1YAS3_9BACL|nr:HAD family phosphatase [Paenibacillus radicis (ex Xue et al. 2023)]MCR8630295.1 HAD family phosphatase [Paenibacillus radicis (ex Xue et al. 2023)]
MIKGIIFDMDGVIIDSHSVAYQLLCETANTFGCNLTIEEIKTWGSLSSTQFWTKVKEQFILPHEISLLIKSYNQDREIELYKFMEPVPGVKEFLYDIKRNQVKTALATSASKKRMDAVINLFGLHTLFDVIVCDEDVVASKPDPQIFLLASEKLAVEPVECLVIEDSENGKIAAKKANMKCLGFKGLSHVKENMDGSDLLFFSFNELNIKELQKRF